MIFKWYDKYKKVNFELRLWQSLWDLYYDDINIDYSKSEWSGWKIDCFWHSPDLEDYQPSRISDLEFNLK